MDTRPIGVFDSGVGGLTVARAIIDLLPHESVVYFGDSARGPWGPRSLPEVRRFATESLELLVAQDVKLIVVACNTASSAALDVLRVASPVPVLDVIEPAVRAAVRLTRNRRVGVIGTVATVDSGRYPQAIRETRENVSVLAMACPRFVEFVERGETTGEEILKVAGEYLGPLVQDEVDTLILACTHYPLLTGVIGYLVGPDVFLVNSAEWVARDVFAELTRLGMHAPFGTVPRHRFLSSGDPAKFLSLGARFLGPEVGEVEQYSAGDDPIRGLAAGDGSALGPRREQPATEVP
jgi:glutamate racemase